MAAESDDLKQAREVVAYVEAYLADNGGHFPPRPRGADRWSPEWKAFAEDLAAHTSLGDYGSRELALSLMYSGGLDSSTYRHYLRLIQRSHLDKPFKGYYYYRMKGGSREIHEEEDAAAIAEATRLYGRPIPDQNDAEGWKLYGIYLYHAGIPLPVKNKLIRNGQSQPGHPELSYYLRLGGYDEDQEVLTGGSKRTDDELIAQLIADIASDERIPHMTMLRKRTRFGAAFKHYNVPSAVATPILEDMRNGSTAVLDAQVALGQASRR